MINCTGPDTDLARVRDPLVAALRRDGLIRPDELGLGLDSDEDGRLIAADGRASSRLSLVGPLRKGRLWENTAVPELRVEARRMAERLAGEAAMPRGQDRSQPEHAGSGSPRTLASVSEPSTREAGRAGRPARWPSSPGPARRRAGVWWRRVPRVVTALEPVFSALAETDDVDVDARSRARARDHDPRRHGRCAADAGVGTA